MKYHVAIKIDDYSAQFTFDSNKEREEFIVANKDIHPNLEIVLSEDIITVKEELSA